jgi:hypothetical protein
MWPAASSRQKIAEKMRVRVWYRRRIMKRLPWSSWLFTPGGTRPYHRGYQGEKELKRKANIAKIEDMKGRRHEREERRDQQHRGEKEESEKRIAERAE